MGAIKNFPKIFYKKISLLAEKLFISNFHSLISSNFLLLILFANLLLLTACEDEVTQPTPKPPGYQEDIPWPSLANSPWPIYRADPQNTGRSKYIGPGIGEIIKEIKAVNLESCPIISNDSLLLFATSWPCSLFAYKNYDSLYSELIGFDDHTTPVIDNQNNLYIFSEPDLIKINSTGEILWSVNLNVGTLSASLNMDKAGNIYLIGDDYSIKSISNDGVLNWSYNENRLMKNTFHSPAFSPDGNTFYLQGETVSLIAFDINTKTIKWEFGNTALKSGPIVDSDGNCYIIPSNQGIDTLILYSIDKLGGVRWQYPFYFKNGFNTEEPALDINGNIIFGFRDTLYSVNYNGDLNWKTYIEANISSSSMIVDKVGNIFFTSITNTGINSIHCFNSRGISLWKIPIDNQYLLYPPILNNDNKLIVPSFRSNYIYVIR